MEDLIDKAAKAIVAAKNPIAVTGAGISVESGIPDFRSPGGLWTTYPPDQFATIDAFEADPEKVWKLWFALGESLAKVSPNAGHRALASLEASGHLSCVITQNIDNLHQEAGSRKVIEYHGNARHILCLTCGHRAPLDIAACGGHAPRCVCAGAPIMKPDVTLFGELIPPNAMRDSELLAQSTDLVLIVGTSAQVYPAAALPMTAKSHGATIIECNTAITDFTPTITDLFLQGKAGSMLSLLSARVNALLA